MKHNMEEIASLCRPLISYLQTNCDPYTEIHINAEEIKITSAELEIPVISGMPMMRKKQVNKENFLKTELGSELENCIKAWDMALNDKSRYLLGTEEYKRAEKTTYWCQAQWEVYKTAIRQFYNVEYYFTRTDEYFGLVTSDETDWLIKVDR